MNWSDGAESEELSGFISNSTDFALGHAHFRFNETISNLTHKHK